MSAHLRSSELPGFGTTSIRFEQPSLQSGISAFLVDMPPGRGPKPHKHPYAETFFVHAGEVEFTVNGNSIRAVEGDIVVVQAHEVHQFVSFGETSLKMTCIHASDEMQTEWC